MPISNIDDLADKLLFSVATDEIAKALNSNLNLITENPHGFLFLSFETAEPKNIIMASQGERMGLIAMLEDMKKHLQSGMPHIPAHEKQ